MSRVTRLCVKGAGVAIGLVAFATLLSIRSIESELPPFNPSTYHPEFVDRRGEPLATTRENNFNHVHRVSLNDISPLLKEAFVLSEDQRFFSHGGVDWRSRVAAVYQAFRQLRVVRGASTISEQAVRILHPRPRSLWTRWLEGVEAGALERQYSKEKILEFYLNQVPYGGRRRGIVEAARYYFDRDLSSLSPREELALVILVRAPERLSPRKNRAGLERRIDQLISRIEKEGTHVSEIRIAKTLPLEIQTPAEPTEAGHFVRFVRESLAGDRNRRELSIETTLDGELQRQVRQALTTLLRRFATNQISNGAALVVNNETGEILAWVNDRNFSDTRNESQIDAVRTVRQPGSTLKPFVYAKALEEGWTAATIIEDKDLVRPVGGGLHRYRNYSRKFHGDVRLREALGSSLNIPAIRAAEFVGRAELLSTLRDFGFTSLRQNSDFYGEGLALGNGEVSLAELVRAYVTLARGGMPITLSGLRSRINPDAPRKPVVSPETSTIIGDILSDPQARVLEFGRGGVLQFPTQTAVKTGTSSGYRDLWAVGYSAQFTVGVWMGNLNRVPTRGLTSSQAPAILLRSVFALLNNRWDGAPLPRRGELVTRTICAETGRPPTDDGDCRKIDELFNRRLNHEIVEARLQGEPRILVPSAGIVIARDPRVPDKFERLGLSLDGNEGVVSIRWFMDSEYLGEATAGGNSVSWPLREGHHKVSARVLLAQGDREIQLGPVGFTVR